MSEYIQGQRDTRIWITPTVQLGDKMVAVQVGPGNVAYFGKAGILNLINRLESVLTLQFSEDVK